ncbi:MAG: hypothetical protein CMN76_12770 [Spirochaetaceae bacterium]|nr:hypothetical protein [Spirochaetaceae bacterium]|tara:strand:+ start:42171 stop:43070 length:900 start_codon:yes stop_codon:yes gene_type:complete
MYYFAYGRNMNQEVMKKRNVWSQHRRAAILEGWQLKFNKRSSSRPLQGYANIEPEDQSYVPGVLYRVDEQGISSLDQYEGYPEHYERRTVQVKDNWGQYHDAICYVANPDHVTEGLLPTREYLADLEQGVEVLGDKYFAHIQWIQSHPTVEDDRTMRNRKLKAMNAGIPELLARIRSEIDDGLYQSFDGKLWAGADVIIREIPTTSDVSWREESKDHILVISENARALSWCMHRLKDVRDLQQSFTNKYEFYGIIAGLANNSKPEEMPPSDVKALLHAMVDAAEEMELMLPGRTKLGPD